MSRISKQIRACVDDPESTGRLYYGEWGSLRPDQRRLIRKLCDECDAFERAADSFYAEIERLTVNMNAFGLTAKNLAEENERLTAQIEHCDACDRIGLTASEHKACIKQARAETITEFHKKYHEKLDFMNSINRPSPSWNTEQVQVVLAACGAIADQVKEEMKKEEGVSVACEC